MVSIVVYMNPKRVRTNMMLSLLQSSVKHIANLSYQVESLKERQDKILTAKTAMRAGKLACEYAVKKQQVEGLIAAVLDFPITDDSDETIHHLYRDMLYCLGLDSIKSVKQNIDKLRSFENK